MYLPTPDLPPHYLPNLGDSELSNDTRAQGQEVEPIWTCTPFLCSHTFHCFPVRPLLCSEILYVSGQSKDLHYRLHHPKNAGAETVGEIVVDFIFLRDKGLIRPVERRFNKDGKQVGKRHYQVTCNMWFNITDRNMRCELLRVKHRTSVRLTWARLCDILCDI